MDDRARPATVQAASTNEVPVDVRHHVYAVHMFKERLQLLITREQRQRLEAEAKRRDASVASVIREAIDARLGTVDRSARMRAVEELGAMEGGRFLEPDELNRAIASERDELPDLPARH